MEAYEKIFEVIYAKDEVTWQRLLYELVKTEQMDLWDINISLLTKKYIDTIKKLKKLDFRVSGKVLLAAAILLKIKSNRYPSPAMPNSSNRSSIIFSPTP